MFQFICEAHFLWGGGLSIYLSMHLSSDDLCIDLSMHLCIYLSIYVSIYLFIFLCIYASIHWSLHPSIHSLTDRLTDWRPIKKPENQQCSEPTDQQGEGGGKRFFGITLLWLSGARTHPQCMFFFFRVWPLWHPTWTASRTKSILIRSGCLG